MVIVHYNYQGKTRVYRKSDEKAKLRYLQETPCIKYAMVAMTTLPTAHRTPSKTLAMPRHRAGSNSKNIV